ncbi:MAG: hypothetical protein L0323_12805 [Planctomycetes bacterium]|nr:hypothetical protein [Planctomycetota bacterium]
MNCADAREAILHRALGEEAGEVEGHLGTCEACREDAARVRAFLGRLRGIAVDGPSPGFQARVLARLSESQARGRILPPLMDLLSRSGLARFAAALLVLQGVAFPVLAALLVLREEKPVPPRIGIERPGEPIPGSTPEPSRPLSLPGWEEDLDPGAPLRLPERARRLIDRRNLDDAGRSALLSRRGGADWVEEHLSRALARLRLDSDAFEDPARIAFVYLALLESRSQPGEGPDGARLADLYARLAPHAKAGEIPALYALWEGFLAGAVPAQPPPQGFHEMRPPRALQGFREMRPPRAGLEAALALRLLRDADEVEIPVEPLPGTAERFASLVRAGAREEWAAGLLAFGTGVTPAGAPGEPDFLAGPLEAAFAARGHFSAGSAPPPFADALRRAAEEGRLATLRPEEAALLLEAYFSSGP